MIYYYAPFDDDENFLELLDEKLFLKEKTGVEPVTFMNNQAGKKGGRIIYYSSRRYQWYRSRLKLQQFINPHPISQ
ncbi:hypothetical protein N1G79_004869 [Escherichia coli]|uniref:hypothetical protein n=1 Tax=Escherichia coli TaxID=562 RepID=UPI000A2D0990|nr:hypothetical protein [Escherichia coli]EEC7356502.1 hypothetical protein [Escherichia coli]EES4346724.1 hypothetical protein [Escherichia coli]EEY7147095.1 hypothetical protein [Escherichia coli]EEY9504570.1 hypothetical protein [Escherichia coli]EFG5624247.1 hypothetical protein [Escherichia coli]